LGGNGVNAKQFVISTDGINTNNRYVQYLSGNDLKWYSRGFGDFMTVTYGTGASTFSSSVTATQGIFNGGTASTSTTTGAVIVTGGIGVSGKIYAGNDINTTGAFFATTASTPNSGSFGFGSTNGMYIYGKAGSVGDFVLYNSGGNSVFTNPTGTTTTSHSGLVQLASYTVAGLPTCNAGASGSIAYVTDALTPAFLVTTVGGGAVKTQVSCNGTNWVSQ